MESLWKLAKPEKTCHIHGVLPVDKIYKRKTALNKNKRGFRYECHYCRIISANKMNKKNAKLYKKLSVDKLLPYYIRDRLAQDGFAREDITPELIEVKRAMILLIRATRDRKSNGKKTQQHSG